MSDDAKTAARWFRKYQYAALTGFIAGVLSGVMTSYLTDHVSFLYILIGAMLIGIAAGSVYAFLLSRFPRKPL